MRIPLVVSLLGLRGARRHVRSGGLLFTMPERGWWHPEQAALAIGTFQGDDLASVASPRMLTCEHMHEAHAHGVYALTHSHTLAVLHVSEVSLTSRRGLAARRRRRSRAAARCRRCPSTRRCRRSSRRASSSPRRTAPARRTPGTPIHRSVSASIPRGARWNRVVDIHGLVSQSAGRSWLVKAS